MTRPEPYPISTVTADEAVAFEHATALAFGDPFSEEIAAHHAGLFDPGRGLAARDGDRIIGTTASLAFTMTVPYARPVQAAGVTSVGVLPTHRRRGVLASLMRRQIDDLHDRGEAWAALYASEDAIYGRYGYGVASRSRNAAIDRAWARFARPVTPGDVELVTGEEALGRVPAIHTAALRDVPGTMLVSDTLWRHYLVWDPESRRDGYSQRFIAVLGDRAYALYRLKQAWSDTGPDGTLRVDRCIAADTDAHRQMWAYLFGIDLVARVTADQLAVDDPLPWWLADRGRLRLTEGIASYIRLVDVGAALSQRGTRARGGVVVDVRDAFCPWNARRWRLEGDGAALSCTPSDAAAADLSLDARELASLSLGGFTAGELARAGMLDEHTPGAVHRLGALLSADRAPWNPFIF